ncbi:hypothetical protein DLM75_20235 [Leptospira stimsonii]|uniref:Uncharacterized protein n=1 Tax=Leptospira stimsonii TaxID=2202203 RepID=A0A396YWM5_9LEPT|nr:hypothetical protein DLM75_20235 [Leptospira stimsonii]
MWVRLILSEWGKLVFPLGLFFSNSLFSDGSESIPSWRIHSSFFLNSLEDKGRVFGSKKLRSSVLPF